MLQTTRFGVASHEVFWTVVKLLTPNPTGHRKWRELKVSLQFAFISALIQSTSLSSL